MPTAKWSDSTSTMPPASSICPKSRRSPFRRRAPRSDASDLYPQPVTWAVDSTGQSFDLATAAYYSAFVKRSQHARQTQSAPSPLVGEGWGGGWCGDAPILTPHNDPHPYPSPQGGGERTECVASLRPQ